MEALPHSDLEVLSREDVCQEEAREAGEWVVTGFDGWIDDDLALVHAAWGFHPRQVSQPTLLVYGGAGFGLGRQRVTRSCRVLSVCRTRQHMGRAPLTNISNAHQPLDGGRQGAQLRVTFGLTGPGGEVHGVQRCEFRRVKGNQGSSGEVVFHKVARQH